MRQNILNNVLPKLETAMPALVDMDKLLRSMKIAFTASVNELIAAQARVLAAEFVANHMNEHRAEIFAALTQATQE